MNAKRAKVAIVTGSNVGIGLETARGLATQGFRVVLAVRDFQKGEAAREDIVTSTKNDDVLVLPLDLASKKSILEFVRLFGERYDRLDVLVNNAGVWTRTRQKTKDGFELTFGVNHLGTFLLTRALLPILEKSAPSRIVVLSSGLHYRGVMHWEDLELEKGYGGTTAYSQSKLANVLFTKALARRLEGKGVTVNAVHPGVVATELTRELGFVRKLANVFLLTPAEGAAASLHVALSDEGGTLSGEYFEKSAPRKASRDARDVAAQEKLWAISEQLLGLESSLPVPLARIAS